MCHYRLFSFRCGHVSASKKPVGQICDVQREQLKALGISELDYTSPNRSPTKSQDQSCRPPSSTPASSSLPPRSSSLPSSSSAPSATAQPPQNRARKPPIPRCPNARTAISCTFTVPRPCPSCQTRTGSYLIQPGRRTHSFNLQLPIKIPADSIAIPPKSATPTEAAASKLYMAHVGSRAYHQVASKKPSATASSPGTDDIVDHLLMMRLRDEQHREENGETEERETLSIRTGGGGKRISSGSDSGYAESFLTTHQDKDSASIHTTVSTMMSEGDSADWCDESADTHSGPPRRPRSVEMALQIEQEAENRELLQKFLLSIAANAPNSISSTLQMGNSASLSGSDESPDSLSTGPSFTGTTRWSKFNEWRAKTETVNRVRRGQCWRTVENPRPFKLPLLTDPETIPDFGWVWEDGKWRCGG